MLSSPHGFECQRCERIVSRRHHDDLDFWMPHRLAPVVREISTGEHPGKALGSRLVRVCADNEFLLYKRSCSLRADKPATYDRYAESHLSPQSNPRSFPRIRRNVYMSVLASSLR